MRVRIDDREEASRRGFSTWLRITGQLDVEVERLQFGDVVLEDVEIDGKKTSVGIEISTVGDLCGKITSGRFNFQMRGLLITYDIAVLLLAGLPRVYKGMIRLGPATFPYARFEGALAAAQMHGVRLICTDVPDDGAVERRILSLAHYFERGQHNLLRDATPRPVITVPLGEPIDSRVEALMSIQGLGEEKAKSLLNQFGSLRAIANADMRQLTEAAGIGPTLAMRIREFFSGEVVPQNGV
jgi:ERCC4-type nuclease